MYRIFQNNGATSVYMIQLNRWSELFVPQFFMFTTYTKQNNCIRDLIVQNCHTRMNKDTAETRSCATINPEKSVY